VVVSPAVAVAAPAEAEDPAVVVVLAVAVDPAVGEAPAVAAAAPALQSGGKCQGCGGPSEVQNTDAMTNLVTFWCWKCQKTEK